ncbi:MAG: hypothetical protein IT480_04110 [Gammaproteobacteria bacterium]|nr:hypothetical protein [Gammaproteobacteria bacterium]
MRAVRTLLAPAVLLAACAPVPQPPLATTVCELGAHPERTVQVDALISVDAEGQALIGAARCPEVKIMLQLSTAAARAGAAGRLKSAAQQAVQAGNTSFPVRLTGVYTSTPAATQFVAEDVTTAVPR